MKKTYDWAPKLTLSSPELASRQLFRKLFWKDLQLFSELLVFIFVLAITDKSTKN